MLLVVCDLAGAGIVAIFVLSILSDTPVQPHSDQPAMRDCSCSVVTSSGVDAQSARSLAELVPGAKGLQSSAQLAPLHDGRRGDD